MSKKKHTHRKKTWHAINVEDVFKPQSRKRFIFRTPKIIIYFPLQYNDLKAKFGLTLLQANAMFGIAKTLEKPVNLKNLGVTCMD